MKFSFRPIAIYLHKKGLNPVQIQYEIDSVFGAGSYSYSAITKSILTLSFRSSETNNETTEEKIIHEEKIELIKQTLKDFPFSSL